MAKYRILPTALPAALMAALALAPFAAPAQEAGTPPAPGAVQVAKMPRVKPAMIRLDFGAGRKVEVNCGDSSLAACVETIAPLVEKVSSMPAERGGKGGWRDGWRGAKGPGGKGHPGKDHPPRQEDQPQPPPPPPAE